MTIPLFSGTLTTLKGREAHTEARMSDRDYEKLMLGLLLLGLGIYLLGWGASS